MNDDATPPRWSIAPYFLVADMVASSNYYRDRLGFGFDRLWGVEDCNGYRPCFGHPMK